MKCDNLPAICRDFWKAPENASNSAVRDPYRQLAATNADWPPWQISELLGFLPFLLTGCAQRKLISVLVKQNK